MLDIASSLAATHYAGQINRVQPASAPAKSGIKTGTIILLSKAALDLSHQLKAIDADREKDQRGREEAQERLRQLAVMLVGDDGQG